MDGWMEYVHLWMIWNGPMYNDLKKIENGQNTGMGMDGGCINP
jgi:hypothetical protein